MGKITAMNDIMESKAVMESRISKNTCVNNLLGFPPFIYHFSDPKNTPWAPTTCQVLFLILPVGTNKTKKALSSGNGKRGKKINLKISSNISQVKIRRHKVKRVWIWFLSMSGLGIRANLLWTKSKSGLECLQLCESKDVLANAPELEQAQIS